MSLSCSTLFLCKEGYMETTIHRWVSLKPVHARLEQEDFFYLLYEKSREPEMALWNWTEQEKKTFLRMQYDFQCRSYQWQYPNLVGRMIHYRGQPVGKLVTVCGDRELRLIDLIIHPDFQGLGIGTSVVVKLQHEARVRRMPLGLSVQSHNMRAYKWYVKLGFEKVLEHEAYISMHWVPSIQVKSKS
ncbi:hypothetical protein CHH67_12975 [Paenibacillus campinasensis]|uniref:N-acetyltransferase domain-containing protein n=2 Tax=Paenibacillus campinasensis TaxID=66347 RepID=A0A268ESL1_9BACL|nr:hypothetical protein CHH67_12975 [Paenibacillus campinasensis]